MTILQPAAPSTSFTMPVPLLSVIPMGIITVLFAVTGTGYSTVSRLANDGKVRNRRSHSPCVITSTTGTA